MATTSIEWTDKTWNPITGCTKISEGCKHCYASVMTNRLQGMKKTKYRHGFKVTLHPDNLLEPTRWEKASMIFVCSMGDLFHKDVSFEFIDKVFDVIRQTPQHTYQILTKRAERMNEYLKEINIPENAWIGVTVENKNTKYRMDYIRDLSAKVKFISCEPLLEDLENLNLRGIDWIIVGGESGVQARPMKAEWAINIKKQAEANNIPFFFKQWGTWGADGIKRNKKANGKILNGSIIQEMPIK